MKTAGILIALLTASGIAAATPGSVRFRSVADADAANVKARQEGDLAGVEKVLADARAASIAEIEKGGGEGRQLFECGQLCSQCRTGAITTAVAEIALCGTAALAVEVFTLGAATILEVAGFVACEAAVVGTLNESEANCSGLVDP
ncbi:hypothetical protein AUP68_04164 [Ilyonectria robusta]